MIVDKTVQAIFDRMQIEDIVSDYVDLRRRGVNLLGLCPFHNEKTPSFTVSPAKNIYKCFGCGEGGNAIQFLMNLEGFSYPDALRRIASKYNIFIEETEQSQEQIALKKQNESFYLINDFAQSVFSENLNKGEEGKLIGLSYFKERGLLDSTIEKFGLGYSEKSGKNLVRRLEKKQFNLELCEDLGLVKKNRDFFWGRVMFPIHNFSGRIVAFAGRILDSNKKTAKYINSPETKIYHKSKVLYGAHLAKKAIRQKDECILVEGYTDVISLHQGGIENIVATSGTALTLDQIKLIKRQTENVKFVFDGDVAGIKAAMRGLDMVLKEDLNVKVVLLPDGHDPDSFLKEVGSTQLEVYLEKEAKDFINFKIDILLGESENDPVKKANFIQDVCASIALIPNPIKRQLFIKEASHKLDITEVVLVNNVNKGIKQGLVKHRVDKARAEKRHSIVSEEVFVPKSRVSFDDLKQRFLVELLIKFGDKLFDEENNISVAEYILGNIENDLGYFLVEAYKKIVFQYLEQVKAGGSYSSKFFVNHEDRSIQKLAVDILSVEYEYSPNWAKKDVYLQTQPMPEENYRRDCHWGILNFKDWIIGEKIKEIQVKLKVKDMPIDQLKPYLIQHQKLLELRQDINEKLFIFGSRG